MNGIITAYSVYCNTSANQSYPEQVIGSNVPTIMSVVNGTTLADKLTGLNPYTQYSCYVTANTSVGEGSPSSIVTVQTAESGNTSLSGSLTYITKTFLLRSTFVHLHYYLDFLYYCTYSISTCSSIIAFKLFCGSS